MTALVDGREGNWDPVKLARAWFCLAFFFSAAFYLSFLVARFFLRASCFFLRATFAKKDPLK